MQGPGSGERRRSSVQLASRRPSAIRQMGLMEAKLASDRLRQFGAMVMVGRALSTMRHLRRKRLVKQIETL